MLHNLLDKIKKVGTKSKNLENSNSVKSSTETLSRKLSGSSVKSNSDEQDKLKSVDINESSVKIDLKSSDQNNSENIDLNSVDQNDLSGKVDLKSVDENGPSEKSDLIPADKENDSFKDGDSKSINKNDLSVKDELKFIDQNHLSQKDNLKPTDGNNCSKNYDLKSACRNNFSKENELKSAIQSDSSEKIDLKSADRKNKVVCSNDFSEVNLKSGNQANKGQTDESINRNNLCEEIELKLGDRNNPFEQIDLKLGDQNNPFERADLQMADRNNPFEQVDLKLDDRNNSFEQVDVQMADRNNPFEQVDLKLTDRNDKPEKRSLNSNEKAEFNNTQKRVKFENKNSIEQNNRNENAKILNEKLNCNEKSFDAEILFQNLCDANTTCIRQLEDLIDQNLKNITEVMDTEHQLVNQQIDERSKYSQLNGQNDQEPDFQDCRTEIVKELVDIQETHQFNIKLSESDQNKGIKTNIKCFKNNQNDQSFGNDIFIIQTSEDTNRGPHVDMTSKGTHKDKCINYNNQIQNDKNSINQKPDDQKLEQRDEGDQRSTDQNSHVQRSDDQDDYDQKSSGKISTTAISTIVVKSGRSEATIALLKSGDWLELRVVEMIPGLLYLGSNLEEAVQLQTAHDHILEKLRSKQNPVQELLNQAEGLIHTQKPRAEVYASMAESLNQAWVNLNKHLETRKNLLNMSVDFHTRARDYTEALNTAERMYSDNELPSDLESIEFILNGLQNQKRKILECSMHTLQEADGLLHSLRSLLSEPDSIDSRIHQITTNVHFACSQIEHNLESLHDRRRFLDALFDARKSHLQQSLRLATLYQNLTEVVITLKKLRDEVSEDQNLGASELESEQLLNVHFDRANQAKIEQDKCVHYVKKTENMVRDGHYAGAEARAKAYSVLEAATALHDACETRTALLQKTSEFFKLADSAFSSLSELEENIKKADTAEDVENLKENINHVVQCVIDEACSVLELTGGRQLDHNQGIVNKLEELEERRENLIRECDKKFEEEIRKNERNKIFLQQTKSISNHLEKVTGLIEQNQNDLNSVSQINDFIRFNQSMTTEIQEIGEEISNVEEFSKSQDSESSEDEIESRKAVVNRLKKQQQDLADMLDSRQNLSKKLLKFFENAEEHELKSDEFEQLLKSSFDDVEIRDSVNEKWKLIENSMKNLINFENDFVRLASSECYPHLNIDRVISNAENMLENLKKRNLVIEEFFMHYLLKMSEKSELKQLWQTYRKNMEKMGSELIEIEYSFCPMLRGDTKTPISISESIQSRFNEFLKCFRIIQDEIEKMLTKAEALLHADSKDSERPEIVAKLLKLYQNIQRKITEYQIITTMLTQWCQNLDEVKKSNEKIERSIFYELDEVVNEKNVENFLVEFDASNRTVFELLKFVENEAKSIENKLKNTCPTESVEYDITKMNEMLNNCKNEMEILWQQKRQKLISKVEEMREKNAAHSGSETETENNSKRKDVQTEQEPSIESIEVESDISAQFVPDSRFVPDSDIPTIISASTNIKIETFDKFEIRDEKFKIPDGEFEIPVDKFEIPVDKLEIPDDKFEIPDEKLKDSEPLVEEKLERSEIFVESLELKLSDPLLETTNNKEPFLENLEDKLRSPDQILETESQLIKKPFEKSETDKKFDDFDAKSVTANKSLEVTKKFEDPDVKPETFVKNLANLESSDKKIEPFDKKLEPFDKKLETSDKNLETSDKKLELFDKNLEISDKKLEPFDKKLEPFDKKLEASDKKLEPFDKNLEIPVKSLEKFEKELESPDKLEKSHENLKIDDKNSKIPDENLESHDKKVRNFQLTEHSVTERSTELLEFYESKEVPIEQDKSSGFKLQKSISEESESSDICRPKQISRKRNSLPKFIVPLQGIILAEGDKAELECTISGFPEPSISWLYNDGPLPNGALEFVDKNRLGLVIQEVNRSHSGRYTCLVKNENGETACTCDLVVRRSQFPPVFSRRLQSLTFNVDNRIFLEVEVSGTPTPDIVWFKDEKLIENDDNKKIVTEGTNSRLVIHKGLQSDTGRYKVIASNKAGRAQCASDIIITNLQLFDQPDYVGYQLNEPKNNFQPQSIEKKSTSLEAISNTFVESKISTNFELKETNNLPESLTEVEKPEDLPSETEPLIEEQPFFRPPGRINIAWPPPPPCEDNIDSIKEEHIKERNVSDIISSFNSVRDEVPVGIKDDVKNFINYTKTSEFFNYQSDLEQNIEVGVEPEYGYISEPLETVRKLEELNSIPEEQEVIPESRELSSPTKLENLQTPCDSTPDLQREREITSSLLSDTSDFTPDLQKEPEYTLNLRPEVNNFTPENLESKFIPNLQREYSDYTPSVTTTDLESIASDKAYIQDQRLTEHLSSIEKELEYLTDDSLDSRTMAIETEYKRSSTEVKKFMSTSKRTTYETKTYEAHPTESYAIVHPATDARFSQNFGRSSELSTNKYYLSDNETFVPNKIQRRDFDSSSKTDETSKNKRESVKQIALRLEESITPISQDEVPGGIRMFPTKTPTPSTDMSEKDVSRSFQEKMDQQEIFKTSVEDSKFRDLEPFPFVPENKPAHQKINVPLPAQPKKFVPHYFDDKHRRIESTSIEHFTPKKIKFDPKTSGQKVFVGQKTSAPPPSQFDPLPAFEGMRPKVLDGTVIKEKKEKEIKTKALKPVKQSKIATKFLSMAENQYTKPEAKDLEPSPQNVVSVSHKVSTPVENKQVFNDISNVQSEQRYQDVTTSYQSTKYVSDVQTKKYTEYKSVGPQYSYQEVKPVEQPAPIVRESPSSVYWSSNTSIKEKRNTLPAYISDVSFDEIKTQSTAYEKSLKSSQDLSQSQKNVSFTKPAHHVTIDSSLGLSDKKHENIYAKHRKPTPNPHKVGPKLDELTKRAMRKEKAMSSIEFKPMPDLEPFPFKAPPSRQSRRDNVPPPPQPKKFVPGTMSETDYESDHDIKIKKIWMPYPSENGNINFGPVNCKLQKGRYKKPKSSSPPPPSTFETPLYCCAPMRPAVSMSDLGQITKPSYVQKTDKSKFSGQQSKSNKTDYSKAVSKSNVAVKSAPRISAPTVSKSDFEKYPLSVDTSSQKKTSEFGAKKFSDYSSEMQKYQTLPRNFSSKVHKMPVSRKETYEYEYTAPQDQRYSSSFYESKTSSKPVGSFREEDSGYVADTESSLPHRLGAHKYENCSSSFYSKQESSKMSSFKSESFGGSSFQNPALAISDTSLNKIGFNDRFNKPFGSDMKFPSMPSAPFSPYNYKSSSYYKSESSSQLCSSSDIDKIEKISKFDAKECTNLTDTKSKKFDDFQLKSDEWKPNVKRFVELYSDGQEYRSNTLPAIPRRLDKPKPHEIKKFNSMELIPEPEPEIGYMPLSKRFYSMELLPQPKVEICPNPSPKPRKVDYGKKNTYESSKTDFNRYEEETSTDTSEKLQKLPTNVIHKPPKDNALTVKPPISEKIQRDDFSLFKVRNLKEPGIVDLEKKIKSVDKKIRNNITGSFPSLTQISSQENEGKDRVIFVECDFGYKFGILFPGDHELRTTKNSESFRKHFKAGGEDLEKHFKASTEDLEKHFKSSTEDLEKHFKSSTEDLEKHFKSTTKEFERHFKDNDEQFKSKEDFSKQFRNDENVTRDFKDEETFKRHFKAEDDFQKQYKNDGEAFRKHFKTNEEFQSQFKDDSNDFQRRFKADGEDIEIPVLHEKTSNEG